MNIIQKALDEVKFDIPPEILNEIFINRHVLNRYTPSSLDDQILSLVIRPRVMVDANLVGGTEYPIPLDKVRPERADDFSTIYRIPKALTQGRSILSVKNITFSDPTYLSSATMIGDMTSSAMGFTGMGLLEAHGSIPTVSSAAVQLIGENVVLVRDNGMMPARAYLRVMLANDDQLSHIQLRSYHAFAEMVVLAVKAYIYTNRRIRLGQAKLQGGQELGEFLEAVREYAEANELYKTYVHEKWTKIAMMNDRESYTRFLKYQIGGHR